jgi:hypothetical protein
MNPAVSEAKLKCVTVMVFEKNGKTIIQPVIRGQDIQNLYELFQKNTLEVWLPNGRPDFEQFDVGILKYRQIVQLSKMCSKVKNRECLKNHFETIVSCKQCPISNEGSQARKRKEHVQLPNISLQVRRLGRCST